MSEPSSEPLIVQVIHRYFPDWEAPADNGREWIKCLCPFHGDSVASAGISYDHNAFSCLACPVKGSAINIIKQQEEVSFAEAKRIAEELSPGSSRPVSRQSGGKSRRRVFGDPRAGVPESAPRGPGKVPARIRGRSTPWS